MKTSSRIFKTSQFLISENGNGTKILDPRPESEIFWILDSGFRTWRQVKVFYSAGIMAREYPMACHSEGATRSKSKFLKPRRPKNLWFKPAGKISFDLTQQKNRPCFGNERFFVGRSLSTKKLSSWLASSEWQSIMSGQYLDLTPMVFRRNDGKKTETCYLSAWGAEWRVHNSSTWQS